MAWQPDGWNDDMSEAPKDGTVIWVWHETRTNKFAAFDLNIKAAQYHPDVGLWSVANVGGNVEPILTHWRHLPSPPSKQED